MKSPQTRRGLGAAVVAPMVPAYGQLVGRAEMGWPGLGRCPVGRRT
jgi:hypothetical protein